MESGPLSGSVLLLVRGEVAGGFFHEVVVGGKGGLPEGVEVGGVGGVAYCVGGRDGGGRGVTDGLVGDEEPHADCGGGDCCPGTVGLVAQFGDAVGVVAGEGGVEDGPHGAAVGGEGVGEVGDGVEMGGEVLDGPGFGAGSAGQVVLEQPGDEGTEQGSRDGEESGEHLWPFVRSWIWRPAARPRRR